MDALTVVNVIGLAINLVLGALLWRGIKGADSTWEMALRMSEQAGILMDQAHRASVLAHRVLTSAQGGATCGPAPSPEGERARPGDQG